MNNATYDSSRPKSNIVPGDICNTINGTVLRELKNAIVHSMGPAGSNTRILKGQNAADMIVEYTKDGNKIIKSCLFENPIEMSIQSEIEEITRHVEKVIGDGTSSAVVLSSLIFDLFMEKIVDGELKNPYKVMRDFKTTVEGVKERILKKKRECTPEDVYKITLISTNGDEEMAEQMQDIYDRYGMDVFIDVSASINGNSYIGEYDGLTLDVGYSDPAYINTMEGVARLHNPRVYSFEDPVDTPQLTGYVEKIIMENIFAKLSDKGDASECIPTVIMAPKMSRDMVVFVRKMVSLLHSYGDAFTQKPPIVILTNIAGLSENIYQNIAQLCGCKPIRKYIDPEIQKKDQESGDAPTLDTICDFYGQCELVEADANNTKFLNPEKMFKKVDGEFVTDEKDGAKFFTDEYTSIITFLETEMKKALESGNELGVAASLKRQLNALRCNMVEFYVGGVSVSERDAKRDLVEDAVLNCRSAAENGVGFGANYEAFYAVNFLEREYPKNEYLKMLKSAYDEIVHILYSTAYSEDETSQIIDQMRSVVYEGPFNIATSSFDGNVLSSIMTDIAVLDTVAKIISIMFTSNQTLVQYPSVNMYC